MNIEVLDPILVCVLLLNFFMLASTRLRAVVYAAAFQGILLGLIYPVAHQGAKLLATSDALTLTDQLSVGRMLLLAIAMIAIKGFVVPWLMFRAVRAADVRWRVESSIGILPSLLVGAIGTALVLVFAARLPLKPDHTSALVIPTSLATVLTGFLILTTRKRALTQVLGYIVLENGIFIFGLLLVEAIPILVELGVLLDVFVGVFVMGIIIHHVSRTFPTSGAEELSALRE